VHRTFLILGLIMLAAPVLAVGKVTTDPNAPGAVKEEQLPATDTRLAKQVTFSAGVKPVRLILDELTKSTGVVFKAGYNSGDWQVRDRKMNVFVKDVPLAQVMNSISHVMKFKWERGGDDGKWTYRLYMDRKTLLDAEAQRVRAEEKAADELTKKRANALAQYGQLGGLTDAQKAKLKTDNPLMYLFAQSGLGDSLSSFCREVPAAADAIANGQKLDLTGDAISPSARASLLRAMRAELSLENRFNSRSNNTRIIPDDLDPATVKITINQNWGNGRNSPDAALLLGDVTFRYDKGMLNAPVIDPEGDFAKLIGKILVQAEDEGRTLGEIVKDRKDEITAAITKVVAKEIGGEPLNEHPDDPALDAKVKMEPGMPALPEVEQELADNSKLSVVSDFFGGSGSLMMPMPGGEYKIRQALDQIGDAYIYNWDKSGKVIEMRDRNWFKKRAAQVPDAWLEAWKRELTKTGTLDIDSLAQMAQLTQDQINVNIMSDQLLGRCGGVIQIEREPLRFYASLSADQRATMFSEPGLDLALLSADQLAQASKVIEAKRGTNKLDATTPLAVTCSRSMIDIRKRYIFSILVEGKSVADWTMIAPGYTPPAPVAKKPAKPADAPKPSEPLGDTPAK
jgi:hypothetical protein